MVGGAFVQVRGLCVVCYNCAGDGGKGEGYFCYPDCRVDCVDGCGLSVH